MIGGSMVFALARGLSKWTWRTSHAQRRACVLPSSYESNWSRSRSGNRICGQSNTGFWILSH